MSDGYTRPGFLTFVYQVNSSFFCQLKTVPDGINKQGSHVLEVYHQERGKV